MNNRKKNILFPLAAALVLTATACGPTSNPTTSNDSDPTVPSVTDPTISNPTTEDSEPVTISPSVSDPTLPSVSGEITLEEFNEKYTMYDFFGHTNKVKIEIDMDPKELFQLSEDYDAYPHHSSPIYRVCDVRFSINDDSVRLNKVGIKLKGNSSRRKFVDENSNIYHTVHFKLDFNEIIDYVDYEAGEQTAIDERTFVGLKKLDIKWNKNYDTSHIKEYVALELYREYDVKSQHIGFAQTVINGTNLGLYYTYENIDKNFAKKYYSKTEYGGDLYKICYTAAGPADFTSVRVGENVGEEDEEANNKSGFFPSYDIKTNKKETDHSHLINMVKVLNDNSSTIANIESVVDLNQFINYEAVSYVLGDPDDLRNNFNNSYLYFNNETNKAEILPYDKDRMFGTQCDWNPTGNGMVNVNPLSNWAQGAQTEQKNPLYRKILSTPISGAETYIETYMNLIDTIFNSSTTLANFNTIYESVESLYSDIVIADNNLESIEFKTSDDINLTFASYIEQKHNYFNTKYEEYKNEK